MIVRCVAVVCAGMVSVSFPQDDAVGLRDTITVATDTSSAVITEQGVSGKDSVAVRRPSEMPPAAKMSFTPERNYDLSVLPVLPGNREDPNAEVGKFTKLSGAFVQPEPPQYGSLKGGYSLYQTIAAEGWIAAHSAASAMLIAGGYRESDGKEQFMDFRKGSVEMNAQTLLSHSRTAGDLEGKLGFSAEEYRLYGSVRPSARRTVVGFTGGGALRSTIGERGEVTATIDVTSIRLTDTSRVRSTTLAGSLDFTVPLGKVVGYISAGAKKSLLSGTGGTEPYMLHGKMGIRTAFGGTVVVEAGAGMYAAGGSTGSSVTRIVPEWGITWYVERGTTLSALYRPGVTFTALHRLLAENPYLAQHVTLRHTDERTSVRISGEREFSDQTNVKVSIGYKAVDGIPLYVDSLRAGEWSVAYSSRTTLFDVTVQLQATPSEGDVVGVSGVWRNSNAAMPTVTIPYLPEWEAGMSYNHGFSDRVQIHNRVKYRGKRHADIQGSRTLGGNFQWDAELRFRVAKRVLLSVLGENLLNQRNDLWEGYRGEPRRVGAAISVSW